MTSVTCTPTALRWRWSCHVTSSLMPVSFPSSGRTTRSPCWFTWSRSVCSFVKKHILFMSSGAPSLTLPLLSDSQRHQGCSQRQADQTRNSRSNHQGGGPRAWHPIRSATSGIDKETWGSQLQDQTDSSLILTSYFAVTSWYKLTINQLLYTLSCWWRLLAPAEPRRIQGSGFGRGLHPVRALVPCWNGATSHHLWFHHDPNTPSEAEGDPGQGREDPPGPSAASSCSETPQTSCQHQSHQPPPGEPAGAAAAAGEESSGFRSTESMRPDQTRPGQGAEEASEMSWMMGSLQTGTTNLWEQGHVPLSSYWQDAVKGSVHPVVYSRISQHGLCDLETVRQFGVVRF